MAANARRLRRMGIGILAFAVLVLAEVFRRGTQMQDEQALTV